MSWRESAECAQRSDDETYWLRESTSAGRWDSAQHRRAKLICHECPVRKECLTAALKFEKGLVSRSRHGIWGATTPDERVRLSRHLKAVSV